MGRITARRRGPIRRVTREIGCVSPWRHSGPEGIRHDECVRQEKDRLCFESPQRIDRAFLDPAAVASWRPPEGMKCQIFAFDPREGGTFRMCFAYTDSHHALPGKTSEHADVFRGQFLQLVPNERIMERVEFESHDPAFACDDDYDDPGGWIGRYRGLHHLRGRTPGDTAERSPDGLEVNAEEPRRIP